MAKPKIQGFFNIALAKKYSVSGILLFFAGLTLSVAQPDIKTIKKRVVAELMNAPINDAKIQVLVTTLNEKGTWPGIDYEDVSREGFLHRIHASNMLDLARAYKTRSSKFLP